MVVKLGKYIIFYRHFLYGSALTIGTVIGSNGNYSNYIIQIALVLGTLLMATSVFVTLIVNRYPEDFKREVEDRFSNDV